MHFLLNAEIGLIITKLNYFFPSLLTSTPN